MKKMKTCLIASAVVAASINSFADVLVSDAASSIVVSTTEADSAANGYLTSADSGALSFTMTGGSVTVSTTGLGSAARGVYSDTVTVGGAAVNVSGGTMTVSESGDKDAALFRMNDDQDSLIVSGGTFNLTESGDGAIYGVRQIRDGAVNISGGTWNFSQDDSSVGAIFLTGNGADGAINLSGGLFNNLDQFDNHISLARATASMNISGLTLADTGLTYVGDAIQDLTGTVAGTLEDGNAYSFNFTQGVAGMISTTVIPEPVSLGLIAVTGVSVLFIRRRLMI